MRTSLEGASECPTSTRGTIVSETHFGGDIIITELRRIENRNRMCNDDNDWCSAIDEMNAMYENTIYGDWGCTTWRMFDGGVDKVEKLGQFYADADMVAVMPLDEALCISHGHSYPIACYRSHRECIHEPNQRTECSL